MASRSGTEAPICYLCVANSLYSVSGVQLSSVNNSLLRKLPIAAFVYSTAATFSTHPASLPSCSSILGSSASQGRLCFCCYCRHLHLQPGIAFAVGSPGCDILSFWSGWPFLRVFGSLPFNSPTPKLVFWEPDLSRGQSFV